MKNAINMIVLCLLGIAVANPAIAGKKLSYQYAVSTANVAVSPEYVEQRVREYFHDIPVMIAIAECESEFRQYEADGRLLVNKQPTSSASGVYQILYTSHKPEWSKSPQTDITTLEGNLRFARKFYEAYGTSPWNSSKPCWSKKVRKYA